MNPTRKLLMSAIFAVSIPLTSLTANAGGVPVIDLSNLGQAILEVENQVVEIGKLQSQINAMTGNSMLGQLLNDTAIRDRLNSYLPSGYSDIYQVIKSGDSSAMQAIYQQVMASEQANRAGGNGKERLATTMLANKANMGMMMNNLNQRQANIQYFLGEINRTTDQASKQDLLNRMTAEQSMISVDMNKMQIMIKVNEQNEKLAREQIMSENTNKYFQ